MTALESQLSASIAAHERRDEIEAIMRDAIRHGACDLVAARFGANALAILHGQRSYGQLPPAVRETALRLYEKRAAQMRAEWLATRVAS